MVNAMTGWLEDRGRIGDGGEISLPAQFIEGATMARPKS
jgi:hypothetical protein